MAVRRKECDDVMATRQLLFFFSFRFFLLLDLCLLVHNFLGASFVSSVSRSNEQIITQSVEVHCRRVLNQTFNSLYCHTPVQS